MRVDRKFVLLLIMFLLQIAFVFFWDYSFKKGMDQRRELVLQDSAAGRVPAEQAGGMALMLIEIEYTVSSYARNALLLPLIFNYAMLLVATGDGRKDDD